MKARRKCSFLLSVVALMVACARSELEVPANHPGHANARAGKRLKTTAFDATQVPPEPTAAEPPPHSGHGEHGVEATYVCPMHPEVVSKQPGNCPICGMQLEPKKVVP